MNLTQREFLTAVMKEASLRIPHSSTSKFFKKTYEGFIDYIISSLYLKFEGNIKAYKDFVLDYNINTDDFNYTQIKLFYKHDDNISIVKASLYDKGNSEVLVYDIYDIDDYFYNLKTGYAVRLFRESE